LPHQAAVRRFLPVSQLGDASIVLICLTAFAIIGQAAASWNAYLVVRDLGGAATVTDPDLARADGSVMAASVLVVFLLVASAVVFLWWLWRARNNAELRGYAEHRRSRGWVIGAWFCPIVNLWFPMQIVDDVWRASDPRRLVTVSNLAAGPTSALIWTWWWAWIIGNIADRFASGFAAAERTADSAHTTAVANTVSALFWGAAAVAIVLIIRRISTWQTTPRQPE
jgi:hypothetical protein